MIAEHDSVVLSGYGIFADQRIRRGVIDIRPTDNDAHDDPIPDVVYPVNEQILAQVTLQKKQSIRWVDHSTRMVLAAVREALESAGLPTIDSASKMGIMVSSSFGCLSSSEEYMQGYREMGPTAVSPMLFAFTVPNAVTGALATELGLRGPTMTFVGGASAAFTSAWAAWTEILKKKTPAMICGGYDGFSLLAGRYFRRWNRRLACRSGYAEGAGSILLESMSSCRERNGAAYAKILGWGLSGAGSREPNLSDELKPAILKALANSELKPDQITEVIPAAPADSVIGSQEMNLLKQIGCNRARILRSVGATTGVGLASTGMWSIIHGAMIVQAAMNQGADCCNILLNVIGLDGAPMSLVLGNI